jgi:hypothetical protein
MSKNQVEYEVIETKDLGYVDNKGHGDDYGVARVYAYKYSPRTKGNFTSWHKAKKARYHYEYFNYATYETKRTKQFDDEHDYEAHEILEALFDKLNKVPLEQEV